eukprot:SAG11_NODE_3004_length_2774_cov_1.712897_4_plen_44_part_00
MVKKAQELAAEHGWFLARQFENEANPAVRHTNAQWAAQLIHTI